MHTTSIIYAAHPNLKGYLPSNCTCLTFSCDWWLCVLCWCPFSGTTRGASVKRNLFLDFYGARKDNRGRHTNHPAWHHSIQTNQRPTSVISPLLRWMPFLPQPSHFILA